MYTLVPNKYREHDPRSLLYHNPSIPIVKYAKLMQEFCFHQGLEIAEKMAHRQDCVLVPYGCVHWQRAKNYGEKRKIKVGRNSFFILRPSELTRTEVKKIEHYIDENGGRYLEENQAFA